MTTRCAVSIKGKGKKLDMIRALPNGTVLSEGLYKFISQYLSTDISLLIGYHTSITKDYDAKFEVVLIKTNYTGTSIEIQVSS